MLKKKNIAMVMAATTVATSVAPVFASTVDVQKVDEAKMIAEVEKMLNTRYSNATETGDSSEMITQAGQEYKNSVYVINTVTNGAHTSTRIESVEQLKHIIENEKVAGRDLTLEVTDKGHKEENGRIVATEVTKNDYYTSSTISALNGTGTASANGISSIVSDTTSATINLVNGQKIDLLVGDYVLDLNKPVDANGNLLLTQGGTLDVDAQRKVVGFKLYEGAETIRDIASKRIKDLTITSKVETKLDLTDLYSDAAKYTQKGADLVNLVVTTKDTTPANRTVVKDGNKYYLGQYISGTTVEPIKTTKDGYELIVNLEVRDKQSAVTNASTNVRIVVSSKVRADLEAVYTDMTTIAVGSSVSAGNYTTLAGDDRFSTAVEVSKETFYGKNDDTTAIVGARKAQSVVLVGEEAIVDGLAAAPLAAKKTAPILLTKKDTVPTETMNEIKRLVGKGTTIYLVGGENNISKDVELQLIEEMNANIVRLAGEDRYETSIQIAEEVGTTAAKAFVVGGDGLADAMSIASVAAKTQAPIIVTPVEGLTKDAKNYLKDTTTITDVDVVGGEAKISTQVLKDITSTQGRIVTVERIAGLDRSSTNAKVIEKYFKTEASVVGGSDGTASLQNVYVAKDGDKALVDALSVAPLAGHNTGAIVLATNGLSQEQNQAVTNTMQASGKTLTQAGNGISSTVIEKLVKLLGL